VVPRIPIKRIKWYDNSQDQREEDTDDVHDVVNERILISGYFAIETQIVKKVDIEGLVSQNFSNNFGQVMYDCDGYDENQEFRGQHFLAKTIFWIIYIKSKKNPKNNPRMNTDYGLYLIITMYTVNVLLVLLNFFDERKLPVLLAARKDASLMFHVFEPRVASTVSPPF